MLAASLGAGRYPGAGTSSNAQSAQIKRASQHPMNVLAALNSPTLRSESTFLVICI